MFELFSIPDEWLSLGMIEGELHPCPGLAFIPKNELKSMSGDYIHQLNNFYEVSRSVPYSWISIYYN